jgi:hypothetical protein
MFSLPSGKEEHVSLYMHMFFSFKPMMSSSKQVCFFLTFSFVEFIQYQTYSYLTFAASRSRSLALT